MKKLNPIITHLIAAAAGYYAGKRVNRNNLNLSEEEQTILLRSLEHKDGKKTWEIIDSFFNKKPMNRSSYSIYSIKEAVEILNTIGGLNIEESDLFPSSDEKEAFISSLSEQELNNTLAIAEFMNAHFGEDKELYKEIMSFSLSKEMNDNDNNVKLYTAMRDSLNQPDEGIRLAQDLREAMKNRMASERINFLKTMEWI